MDADEVDEGDFFRALESSAAKVLLIGRRALIVLGIPVLTADYDLWTRSEDAAALNHALASLGLLPNRTPDEARRFGRYVLENGERVDVLIAREVPTVDGVRVRFEDVYARSELIEIAPGVRARVPSIPDLISTKRFAARAKDIADIRLLESLLNRRGGT